MGSLREVNPSYWVGTSPETSYEPLAGPLSVDVAVLGGGVAGLSTAVLLAREGARVALVEAGRVASGVTGYTTAKVTSLHGLIYADLANSFGTEGAATYAAANQAGLDLVARLVDELAVDCDFGRASAYTYTESADGVAPIEAEVDAAVDAGLPARFVTDTDLPYPVEAAVEVVDQAYFHPRRYCLALAELVAREGTLVERTRAVDVAEGDRATVRTDRGDIEADHVVVATHLPFLDRGGFFAKAHPVRSYCLAVRLPSIAPQGMYLSSDTPTRSVRPVAPGSELAVVGGESHKCGQDPDTRQRYAALEAWARERFAGAAVEYRWSAQDYIPVDRVPYVGRMPRTSRVLVATGFSKWGFTNGSAAALMLADAVAGRENPWAALFDATRVDPVHSAKEFIKENVNVGQRFVGDRLSHRNPRSADELTNGEGEVAELDGEQVAAYRDGAGGLHTVSPVCTHLGCHVTFNTAERSWDCPCHGSRFDVDGRVIQGPATRDLETIERRGDG